MTGEPLDLDALETRIRGLDLSNRDSIVQLDGDMAALIAEVRQLRKGLDLTRYEVNNGEEYGAPVAYLECIGRSQQCLRFSADANSRTLADLIAAAEQHEQEAHR